MKKFFVILVILLILLIIIGTVLFIATFDINRYKPFVIEQIERIAGHPVTLERLSLGFRTGLAMEIKKLAIYPTREQMTQPAITLDEAKTILKFAPLLKRRFEWAAIHLVRPKVNLTRDKEGKVSIEGFRRAAKNKEVTQSMSKPPAVVATLPILVDNILVEGGEVRISDKRGFASELTVRDITVSITNLSLGQPSRFLFRSAFLSDKPNLNLTGTFYLSVPDQHGYLRNAEMDIDLGTIRMEELIKALPEASEWGVKEPFTGKLSIKVPHLAFTRAGVREWKADINLSNGGAVLTELKSRLQGIILKATVDNSRVTVQNLYLTIAGGQANFSGAISYTTEPVTSEFTVNLQGLVLNELLPTPPRPNQARLHGILSLTLQGGAKGTSWVPISQSIRGEGTLNLSEGRIENLNILRDVFEKISVIPGLLEKLLSRLPPSYAERLNRRDTVFQPINLPFVLQGGVASFRELHVITDSLELHGSGRLGLDGTVAFQANLVIDPDLSLAFIKTVNELQYLAVDGKRISIPVTLRGRLDQIRVLPDLQYIAKRVAMAKTQQIAGGFLQKALEKKGFISQQPRQ